MKVGMSITIPDMKNLLKDKPCRISCLDLKTLMMSGENEEFLFHSIASGRVHSACLGNRVY